MSFGQEIFIPTKPDNVSDSVYKAGEQLLLNAYEQIADDNYNILAADYWNFATAYNRMGQSKETIYDFLFKARATNQKDFL